MAQAEKRGTGNSKLPSPHRRIEMFGGAQKGVVVCVKCGSYFYKKAWHHDAKAFLAKRENKGMPVTQRLCPVDERLAQGKYGGKLVITRVPAAEQKDLLNLVRGFCERAEDRDPLARLIALTVKSGTVTVTVSENRLAQHLAKKISDAFKKKAVIAYLREPDDIAQIAIEFSGK
ncbi:hypothetical protein KGO95_01720 [Patescibacteria group bacterium]|nr:hypothetical protein [Patescibacteria group bacterium]